MAKLEAKSSGVRAAATGTASTSAPAAGYPARSKKPSPSAAMPGTHNLPLRFSTNLR
jgi:hypothetical protein